jgi:hypothetical protein
MDAQARKHVRAMPWESRRNWSAQIGTASILLVTRQIVDLLSPFAQLLAQYPCAFPDFASGTHFKRFRMAQEHSWATWHKMIQTRVTRACVKNKASWSKFREKMDVIPWPEISRNHCKTCCWSGVCSHLKSYPCVHLLRLLITEGFSQTRLLCKPLSLAQPRLYVRPFKNAVALYVRVILNFAK